MQKKYFLRVPYEVCKARRRLEAITVTALISLIPCKQNFLPSFEEFQFIYFFLNSFLQNLESFFSVGMHREQFVN